MSSVDAGAGAAPPRDVSAAGRIPGAFFSPVDTFRSIAARPTFLLPLILWTVASLLVTNFILPRVDYDKVIRGQFEKRGTTAPEDRIQQVVAQQKKIAPVLYNAIGALSPALVSLLVTLVFWASFKAFGWDFTFKQGFGVTTHAFLPGVLGALLLLPILASKETVDPQAMGDMLRSNPGFLVDAHSAPALHSLLGSIDVFSIWSLALLSIGYGFAGRTSRKSAFGVVVTIWALFVLGKAGLAALLPH